MKDYSQERSKIIHLTKGLLKGPLDVSEAIPSPPADTYLTGILWPEGEPLDSTEDDRVDGVSSAEDSEIDSAVPGYRTIRPCSIGLTFAADSDATISVSLDETARYIPVRNENPEGDQPRRYWQRVPLDYRYQLLPGDTRTGYTSKFLDRDGQEISDPDLCLHFKRRIDGDLQILTITLINKAVRRDDRLRDEFCLFQAGLEIHASRPTGTGAIRPRPELPTAGADADRLSAALLYRDKVEYAVGHGVAVEWGTSSEIRVDRVATTWLPTVTVKGMSAEGHPMLVEFFREQPDALRVSWLARIDARDEITETLTAFVAEYRRWISDSLEARLDDIPEKLHGAAQQNLAQCLATCRRMEEGVTILQTNYRAWHAFVLSNSAIDRQACYEAKGSRKGPLTWRPFQLAYLLLVLPGLVEPDNPGRGCFDLLWFPTGGGKTEAYLALTAFQIFFRRITDATRRNSGGVDVLMRYTLRLLTVQQFQRAASLICACDAIRREMGDLGSAPISLGLYVGGSTTPNRDEDARDALRNEHQGTQPSSTPCQLLNCPVCGKELPSSSYREAADGTGIEIRCHNQACETAGELLPVLTVDDYIYSSPPSLVIGTIDKFAQLPRRKDLGTLFGLDGGLRPGLIIQDELHLISGPLGSMAGLYETAIDLMCTDKGIRPKVIGSTATIGQAERQVRALFDRSVLQFPPSGFDASDSFFAVRDEKGPNRIYLGLSSSGRSPKFALQAAVAAFLQGVEHLKAIGTPVENLDPFWTAVIYFNSLRELGGAHVLLQDDIPRQMEFLARRLGGPRRKLEAGVIELSSRMPSRQLPEQLNQLEVHLSSTSDNPFASRPRDTVLASNMISVGVDISRLGLMLVNGQPKSTAEYIQASSRIGRGLHGIVLTLHNFGRPRDVSHFEHFQIYHDALYRNVEATSVTPWAPRARDKALHAVVASAVRHLIPAMENDEAAISFDPENTEVQALLSAIRDRADTASFATEGENTASDLEGIVQRWHKRCQIARNDDTALLYWERKAPYGRTRPHLMTSAEEGKRSGQAWTTPNSMREVEPSTAFNIRLSRNR